MKDLKEMDFETLKNNFDNLCSEINEGTDAVALTLKSGRKVYIMPEQSYDNISRFVIRNTSVKVLH